MSNSSWPGLRAGFWRRFGALLCDIIVVIVPLQLMFVVLYAMSDGTMQSSSVFSRCSDFREIPQLPEGLTPPPPAGSNFARLCHGSFFGLETGRWLVIGRVTKEGIVTKSISVKYWIGVDGKITNVIPLDWVTLLAPFIYLVAMECRFGATLGKRLLHIRAADIAEPRRIGIPLRKAVIRNLLIPFGAVPMLVVLLVFVNKGDLEGAFGGNFFVWFGAAGVLGQLWNLWILIDLVCKRDPIYDRIAGTAVLRETSMNDQADVRQNEPRP
jgi:uncharacterized RDD family membrane protein YckC